MQHVGPIFFGLCVGVVVPILLARFVMRADWRTIRNVCFLWYGSLVIVFVVGGLANAEEVAAWAPIFALLMSIWVVPALSLILKLWGRLGATGGQAAAGSARRPFWARAPLAVMSPLQWAVAALLLVGGVGFAFWQDHRDLNASVHVLRQMFAVPEGAVVLEASRLTETSAERPQVEAIVQLTPAQFEGFRARMEGDQIWPGAGARFGGAPLRVTSPETVRWRPAMPARITVGRSFANWSRLTEAPVRSIRNGRVLCLSLRSLVLNTHAERSAARANKDYPRYVAVDCADVAPDEGRGVVALAALDLDSRMLYMIIR
jgi:hypothetical protein